MSKLVEAGSYARGGRLISWISIAPKMPGHMIPQPQMSWPDPFPGLALWLLLRGWWGIRVSRVGRQAGVVWSKLARAEENRLVIYLWLLLLDYPRLLGDAGVRGGGAESPVQL